MNNCSKIAIFLIAACAISTGAWGQKVYRCGASYSQIPCAGAVDVETGDARSKIQKSQADKSTVRDTTVANTMEKTRKQNDAKAIAQSNAGLKTERLESDKAGKKAKGEGQAKDSSEPAADLNAKKKGKKKKEPEFFTAKSMAEPKPDGKTGALPATK